MQQYLGKSTVVTQQGGFCGAASGYIAALSTHSDGLLHVCFICVLYVFAAYALLY
jgi:hypothetical protein